MGTRKRIKRIGNQTRKIQKGGAIAILPPIGPPNWPDLEGCEVKSIKTIPIRADTYLDRIGDMKGTFVAVIQRDLKTHAAKPASYSSRCLRTLGETPYPYPLDPTKPDEKSDVREKLYEMILDCV